MSGLSRRRRLQIAALVYLALATLLLTTFGADAATAVQHRYGAHPAAAKPAPASPVVGPWKNLAINAPQPVAGAALAWDGTDGLMFSFGGRSAGVDSNDLWAYRPTAAKNAPAGWSHISTSGNRPEARTGGSAVWDSTDGVLLVFDGTSHQQEMNSLWAYKPGRGGTAPGRWVDLTSNSAPQRRAYHDAVWDSTDGVMLVFGGEMGGSPLGDTWDYKPSRGGLAPGVWTRLGAGPLPRQGAMAAWDATDKLMLLAGGQGYTGFLTDLWAFQPANRGASGAWTRITATTPLGARARGAAVWDSTTRRLLVFGGQAIITTTATTPTPIATHLATATGTVSGTPTPTPTGSATASVAGMPAGASHASPAQAAAPPNNAPASPARLAAVTVTPTPTPVYVGDLWAYTPAAPTANTTATATPGTTTATGTWQQLYTTSAPSPRSSGAVFDDKDHQLLLYGGQGVSTLGDLWSYPVTGRNAGRWSLLNGGSPQARVGETGAWDTHDGVYFIFGGYSGGWLNDLWAYKPARGAIGHWALISAALPPAPRTETSMVWDTLDNVLLLFGGSNQHGEMNDVWAYRPTGDGTGTGFWYPLITTSAPQSRRLQSAVWDSRDHEMIVYGGEVSTVVLRDLWAFRPNIVGVGGIWQNLMALTPPTARFGQAAVWDPTDSQMLVFGGVSGAGNFLGDLWAYRPDTSGGGTTWVLLGTPGSPDGRSATATAWDPVDRAMLFFGGTGNKSIRNDSYVYRVGHGWAGLNRAAPPDRRSGSVGAFDTVNNAFLTFGGEGSSGARNDLWQLGGVQATAKPKPKPHKPSKSSHKPSKPHKK